MKDIKTNSPSSSTAVRALKVLETVAASKGPISVSDVAQTLGLDKVTAYRMLITLEQAGYIVRDTISKRFSMSYKVVSLSRNLLAENEVSKLVQEKLREISNETQETLHYSILDRHEAVLVHIVKGTQVLSVNFQIGDRSLLHATSIGKVLLAYQNDEYIEAVIARGLPRYTDKTLTKREEFLAELQQIRSQGYALDDKEFSMNMRCIAVPVFEGGGFVRSGISISGPATRFSYDYLKKLKEPMLHASRDLSRRLGGLPWDE